MSEEPNKYEAEDSFHNAFKAGFLLSAGTGQFIGSPEGNRWKLTYLDQEGILKSVTGDLRQTVETFTCMIQLGYPVMQVSDLGFVELIAMEGLDITSNAEDLKRAANEYREFARQTRG